ncbi:MAG: STAS domain-containing protein, partial [Planctomycetota bacterium]|nr:STAS domain-containing protein [Planctomycetota bacterium]
MPDFSFETERVTDIPDTILLVVSGAIDAKTVPSFQENMSKLRDNGMVRYVMDMEGIKYINSTGFGYLVNLADTLQPMGGGVALVRIHPKVKVVIDMLGLNDFFHIYSSRKEALAFFKDQAAGGKPAAAAPQPATSSAATGSDTVVLSPMDEAALARQTTPAAQPARPAMQQRPAPTPAPARAAAPLPSTTDWG